MSRSIRDKCPELIGTLSGHCDAGQTLYECGRRDPVPNDEQVEEAITPATVGQFRKVVQQNHRQLQDASRTAHEHRTCNIQLPRSNTKPLIRLGAKTPSGLGVSDGQTRLRTKCYIMPTRTSCASNFCRACGGRGRTLLDGAPHNHPESEIKITAIPKLKTR